MKGVLDLGSQCPEFLGSGVLVSLLHYSGVFCDTVNYYHKTLHLECCSSPRSTCGFNFSKILRDKLPVRLIKGKSRNWSTKSISFPRFSDLTLRHKDELRHNIYNAVLWRFFNITKWPSKSTDLSEKIHIIIGAHTMYSPW